jgi:diaminohydroxyphosphoribosylaminopyrimidine deaminase/5-amino-6-(5-phosphoribosylamino)uracil reductase
LEVLAEVSFEMITPLGAMKLAIEEAQKGFGFVAPNPPVGCVILDQQENLLAKGFHRIYGGDHAEIDALKQIKDPAKLKGATVYVTLEPCAHQGKTGSCAKMLATLPIAKVVYGLEDPFREVSGKGLEILSEAGITVEKSQHLADELEELAEVFLYNHRQQKTFVAIKVATSLDGLMAHISGDSRWITGDESREYVHFLRAQFDAVLVGKNTFLKDDPKLNIRHPKFVGKKNKVIFLDTDGSASKQLEKMQLFQTHEPEDIYVVSVASIAGLPPGVQSLICKSDSRGFVDLEHLLKVLFEKRIFSIFVEGGATVLSEFLQRGLVQRYYQFIAPVIMGAKTGLSFSRDVSIAQLPDRRELRCVRTQSFGSDILVTGRLDPLPTTGSH